jgi:hypothetical protein
MSDGEGVHHRRMRSAKRGCTFDLGSFNFFRVQYEQYRTLSFQERPKTCFWRLVTEGMYDVCLPYIVPLNRKDMTRQTGLHHPIFS